MFRLIIQRLRQLVCDENGPTAVEYAVMLALIIIVAMGSIGLLGDSTNSVFRSAEEALHQTTDGSQDGTPGKTDGNLDGNGQY